MRVGVTGSEGYIGSVLMPLLRARGHDVVGIDTRFYSERMLYIPQDSQPPLIARDSRKVTVKELAGLDAVIHLAELSNDSAGANDPKITFDINHLGTVGLAKTARDAGVRRFIQSSSCSVYGVAEEMVNEESPVDPITAYAQCKVIAEDNISALANENFSPVFLRNATAFGPSPRMRFDIVLNDLAGRAWTMKIIKVLSDGTPWRPLVHVKDICFAMMKCLEAPRSVIHNQVFNVGGDEQNYRVREIADTVDSVFPGCKKTFGPSGDNRSYRVSFRKIREHLGFTPTISAHQGAIELYTIFSRIKMTPADFGALPFTRLKQLKRLIETGQLDRDLFWTPVVPAS